MYGHPVRAMQSLLALAERGDSMKTLIALAILAMAIGAGVAWWKAANAWPLPTCGNFICSSVGEVMSRPIVSKAGY